MDGDKQIERQTKTRERQAGRKTDRQTGRQADRQIYTTCIGLLDIDDLVLLDFTTGYDPDGHDLSVFRVLGCWHLR